MRNANNPTRLARMSRVHVALGLLLAGAWVAAALTAAQDAPSTRPAAGAGRSPYPQYATAELKPGDLAPDFDLPRLESYRASMDSQAASKPEVEKVKLSAFRGKKPVCLIFASYT